MLCELLSKVIPIKYHLSFWKLMWNVQWKWAQYCHKMCTKYFLCGLFSKITKIVWFIFLKNQIVLVNSRKQGRCMCSFSDKYSGNYGSTVLWSLSNKLGFCLICIPNQNITSFTCILFIFIKNVSIFMLIFSSFLNIEPVLTKECQSCYM